MVVDINWLAIIVSVVVLMVIGALWYSPMLFANSWMKIVGKKEEDLKGGASTGYVIAIIADIVMAYVLSHVVDYTGATTALAGAQAGFWMWLGFVAPTMVMNNVFEGRPTKLFWINAGMQLVGLLIVGAILAAWQ
jgi:hypothetical protein